MTMSNRCKWISFSVMSAVVILLLLLFYSMQKDACPHEDELMFKDTETCYLRQTKGPCSNNLVIMEEVPAGSIGSCSCPYLSTNRTMLYKGGECYHIFTQAFCPEGHWLNISVNREPICEMNPCMQHAMNSFEADKNANDDGDVDMKSNDQFDHSMHDRNNGAHNHNSTGVQPEWVPIKGGRCAQLGRTTEGCPEGAVVRFHRRYILPSCFEPPLLPPSKEEKQDKVKITAIGALPSSAIVSCPMGSYRSIMGRCQPSFEFDFDEPEEESPESSRKK